MTDDKSSSSVKIKSTTFSYEERKLLLRLVNEHGDILNSKKADSYTNSLKEQTWKTIHQRFLEHKSVTKSDRTPWQLKRCWENIRSRAKKGDPNSSKLMKWASKDFEMKKFGETISDRTSSGGSDSNGSVEETISSLKDLQQTPMSEMSQDQFYSHCPCSTIDRKVYLEKLAVEKAILATKLQLLKDKARREKELHKLAVEELELRMENERKRGEILTKELNNYPS